MKKLITLFLFLSCSKSVEKLIDKSKIDEIYWQYIKEDNAEDLQKYLKSNIIDFDKTNEEGEIPLTLAAKFNSLAVLVLILNQEKVDLNKTNKKGQTAFIVSILEGEDSLERDEILDRLMEKEAHKNTYCSVSGNSPLTLAIIKEDIYLIKKILKADINVNDINPNGETALIFAIKSNIDNNKRDEVINWLLRDNTIDVNIQDMKGYTALHYCLLEDLKESMFLKILSYSKPDLNLQDNQGKTLMMHAIEKRSSSLVYLLLNEETINLSIKDINNKSLIEYLLDNFNENVFNLFKDRNSIEKLKFIDHLWVDFIDNMLNDLRKGDLDSFYRSFNSSFKNNDKNKATSFLNFLLKLSIENKENICVLLKFLDFLNIFIEENKDYYFENFKEAFSAKITKKIFEAFNNRNEVWVNSFFYHLKDLKNNKLMFNYFALNEKKQNLIIAASLNVFSQISEIILNILDDFYTKLDIIKCIEMKDSFGKRIVEYDKDLNFRYEKLIFSERMKVFGNSLQKLEIEAKKFLYRRNIDEYNNFLKSNFGETEIENKRSFHLIDLIKENFDDIALKLIDYKLNLEFTNENGLGAIHYATIYGKIELFNRILSKDINHANFKDRKGNSPLIHIIGTDFCEEEIRFKILDILLENSKVILNINSVNDKGYNALLIACLRGDYKIVQKLIDKNVNLNIRYKNKKHLIENLIYLLNSDEREFRNIKEPEYLRIIELILNKGIKLEKGLIKSIAKDNYLSKAIIRSLKHINFNFQLEEIEIFNLEDLHLNIKERNIEKVESYILNNPEEFNSYSVDGKTALHYAVFFPNILRRVLSIPGININIHNGSGNTPLVEILKNYNQWLLNESFDMLLERKEIDVNIIIDNISPPLIFVLKQCKWRTAEKLLKNENIKLYLKDIDGRTAFDIAVLYLEFEIAQKILEKDRKNLVASPEDYSSLDNIQSFLIRSSIHKSEYPTYFESLIFVAERGCNKIISLSLEKKLIDSDFLDEYLDKLFSLAIERFDLELTEILLRSLEDINNPINGKPIIRKAIKKNRAEAVKFFYSKGAKIDTKDDEGNTYLHLACELGYIEVLKFLVEVSSNINICNKNNITPFHLACKLGYIDIVSFLIKNNANINTKDKRGFTPIIDSLLYVENTELFKLLLENFKEIEEDKIKELTLISIFKNNISALKLLLDKKVNFDNSTYLKRSSPLFENTVLPVYYDSDLLTAACHRGNVQILNLLWEKIKFNDHQKLYNLELAIKRRNLEVIKFFIEKGLDVFEIDDQEILSIYNSLNL